MTVNRRVLVLIEYGSRNGGENSWLSMAPWLRRSGWEPIVACPSPSELSDAVQRAGFEHVPWCCTDAAGHRPSQQQIRQQIAALLDGLQPALVHANSLSTSRLAGPVVDDRGVPAVGCLRDIMKVSRQAMADINRLDRVVAVSDATRRYHRQQGLSEKRSQVIYNGVDTTEFMPRESMGYLHRELGLPPGQRLVSCIGQIGLRKGTQTVIQVFDNLARSMPNLELLITGIRHSRKSEAIKYEQDCRAASRLSAVSDRIHWLGRRNDVATLLTESSLLLHAARQEPLGRVLLEATACGCPFVATNVGGTPEIVADSHCRWLTCIADSVPDMTRCARQILCWDSTERSRVRQRLVEIAQERFDVRSCAANWDQLYRRLQAISPKGRPLP